MRVTTSLFYQSSKSDYQKGIQSLYDVNNQLASGMKIQNSYEDSGIFVDTMRLDYEIATLGQVQETSSKAQTFANNTDQTLNQFTDALTQFKTKMIQASSQVNSQTSLDAIADELESLREHMMTLANTSINGQFLFSGSSLSVQPISSDGSYNGNDENLEALIGSGVQLPYNITGKDLFEGSDSDYHRTVSTNVQMYNQSKLHPDVMVLNSGETASEEIYLTADDTIRDMVGDTDNDETNDPNSVFHISGKRSDGSTFVAKIEMQSDEKVSELLEKIGEEFGNTPTNTVVSVSMNDHGQIEITDLVGGNQQLQFHIVGAVDRNTVAGSSGQADNVNLIGENVQVVEFIKSDFQSANSSSTISSRQDIYSPGQFTLGAPMFTQDGDFVTSSTKLRSFMGDEINQIEFNGKNNSGTNIDPIPPLDVINIDDDTTVQDLLDSIEDAYGVSARLENGQIYLSAGSSTDFDANKLQVQLDAFAFRGDGEVQSFEVSSGGLNGDSITVAGYAITLGADSSAEEIASLIETNEANIMASDTNIASIRIDGTKVYIDYKESAGDVADIILSTTGSITDPTASIQEVSPYVASGLAEVQAFEIKEAPTVNGSFTLTNAVSPGSDLVVNFNAGDTPSAIASAISAAITLPFIDANGNTIESVTTTNGTIQFTYAQSDFDVALAPVVISQTAGVDDLIVSNSNDWTLTQSSGPKTVDAFTTFDSVSMNNYNFTKDGDTLTSNVSQVIKATNTYATASTKLLEVSGSESLDNKVFEFSFVDKNGVSSMGQINLQESSPYSTFQIDFDNSGTYEDNEILPLFNTQGEGTKASEVTYQQLMDVISLAVAGIPPIDKDVRDSSGNFVSLADGDLFEEYASALELAKKNVDVYLDDKGVLTIEDKKNTQTPMQFSISDYDKLDTSGENFSFSFMANDAVKIVEPSIDFFAELNDMIDAVRNGEFQMSADNTDPRSLGLNNSLNSIDHLLDHVTKAQTTIGAYSNALSSAQERAELLSINVQTVRSEVIDVDMAEAYLKYQQISTSYQAMLSTVSKINSMSLLQYM